MGSLLGVRRTRWVFCRAVIVIVVGGKALEQNGHPSTLELSAWIFPVSGFVRLVSGRVCAENRDSWISGFLVLVEGNDV